MELFKVLYTISDYEQGSNQVIHVFTKLTSWLGKRFVHFDERVRTGESRTRITEQNKATIWAY